MRIEFGIGAGYTKDGHSIPPQQAELLARQILREVVREFGGGFVTRGEGGWIDDQGNAIYEPGITVTVDVVPAAKFPGLGEAAATAVIDRATQIAIHAGKVFDQTSVHLTFIEARSVNVDSELPLKIN